METFDFIKDEFLLDELAELKKEDPRLYYELVRFVRIHNRTNTDYLTNFINYMLFGE